MPATDLDSPMDAFSLECPGYQPLRFVGERPHEGHDRLLTSNAHGHEVDLLCFLDSRGVSGEFSSSLARQLIGHAEARQQHYVMICRPLELTTWATLVNFLAANPIRPRQIVTNMGFVDFTPKKPDILVDAMRQVEARIGRDVATATFVEESTRLNGEVLKLYSMQYSDAYAHTIERLLAAHPTVIINSPPVSPDCVFPRPRPASFFRALRESNEFNRALRGATIVDLPEFDTTLTYDGVHYTEHGNRLIYERVKEYL